MADWLKWLTTALAADFSRRQADAELNAELRFHLEREVLERLEHGMSPEEARRTALASMGAVEKHKEECRDARRGRSFQRMTDAILQDVRFALRLFRRQPLPFALAIGGLGLALGVGAAVFTLFNAYLFRPYGMDAPGTVVKIARAGSHSARWPYARFRDFPATRSFARVEVAADARVRLATSLTADVAGPRRTVLFVSGGYLEMLGGRPALGRSLLPSDDTPGAPPVVVVSDTFWRGTLSADATAVGKTIWLNDAPATLVGVMRPKFTGPVETPPSAWMCLSAFDDVGLGAAFTPDTEEMVEVIGRLAPGVSRAVAEQRLSAFMNQDASTTTAVEVRPAASPLSDNLEGDESAGLVIAFALLALVLALACANTANVLLASSLTRRHEIGVRLAMGATRRRLVVQMLRESLLLSTIAGGLGLLLATWLVPVLARAMDLSDGLDYSPDWRVLLFMTGLVAIVGTAAGLAPARYGSRGEVLHVLQRGATDRVTRSRLRLPFVGFQAAVSMLLVIVAALLARSALRLSSLSPGFDANRVLAVSLDLPRADFDRQAYFGQAVTVLRALPSIEQISLSQILPFGGLRHSVWLKQRGASWQLNLVHTDDAFFSTTGAHIVQGRGFTSAEIAEEAPIAVVSESIADAFFPAGAAVGRPLSTIPARAGAMAPATIIGVVTDAFLLGFDAERSGTIYRPLIHGDVNPPGLLIRTARPDTVTPEIERTLHRLNPRTRVRTWTVADQMQSYLGAFDRRAWLTAPTAILALVLALLGIYGVTAFAANQRMEEVSVRFAVGATATDIVWLLMKDGLRPVLMGLPIGLGAGFALAQVFARELSAISPYDPISFGAAFWLLTTFAIVAILIPALRMSRVAPATLLRQS